MAQKKGILERLSEGVVIGDGGYVWALEKRGYVKAEPWTPEAAVENPEAVKQLHREFLRAGSDVLQAFTFYASEDKLVNGGQLSGQRLTCETINTAACKIAREVANEGDALVAGGLTHTPSYLEGKGKDAVQAEYRKQVKVFVENDVDFMLCEYYEYIEEMEWAIQVALESGKPVASTMCIGPEGDTSGVSAAECAVRMANAGAKIVGINCRFGPDTGVQTMKLMKAGLEAAGKLSSVHLMVQSLVFHTPDAGQRGYIDLPEFPFALEPRTATRWDIHKYARQAFDMGVRYIGGCCGFEPYHIRAIAEELSVERGKLPAGSEKHGPWGAELIKHTKPWVRARASREYWEDLKPASGRPHCPSFSKPDH